MAKLALLHCADDGLDAFQEQERLGVLLLKVNDHFDTREILFTRDNVDRRTSLLGLITNTLAMKEYANGHFDLTFVRIHRMCKVIAPKRTKDSCYVDIDELLIESIGINYGLLEALTTGVTLKYKLKERTPILDLPILSMIFDEHITGGVVPIEQVRCFMGQVSAVVDQLTAEAQKAPDSNNDLSLFRKFPFRQSGDILRWQAERFGHVLFDQGFLLQKVSTIPYWAGVERRTNFQQFWGSVFEDYVGELLQLATSGTGTTYIHSPTLGAQKSEENS